MKKAFAIVALVAAMFVAGKVQAQTTLYATYAPETFVEGSNSKDYKGFSAGFSHNIGISGGFGVAAGAQFRMNMRNATQTIWGITGTTKETQTLIDVPVLFNYDIAVNHDLHIYPFVGPMPSLALTGTTKGVDPIFGENSYDWYDDSSNLSRLNLYAVFGADVAFGGFNLFGGYRLGLLDINKNDNTSLKTNGFYIGLGFTL